jgi:hypothetical protein
VGGRPEGRDVSTLDVEAAMMAAEHAARAALLEHGVDLTALVLNVTFNTADGGKYALGSKVPDPPPEFLAASLYQSATEAGLSASDMW